MDLPRIIRLEQFKGHSPYQLSCEESTETMVGDAKRFGRQFSNRKLDDFENMAIRLETKSSSIWVKSATDNARLTACVIPTKIYIRRCVLRTSASWAT